MSRISENIRKITKAWGGKTTGNGISDALADLYNNLPFGVKTEMVEIVPEQSVTGSAYDAERGIGFTSTVPKTADLVKGSKYTVYINGAKYDVIGKEMAGIVGLGDERWLGAPSSETTNPFVLVPSFDGGDTFTFIWEDVESLEKGEKTITFSVSTEQEIVKQLDHKFVGASGGGGSGEFVVTFTSNDGATATCDKTFDEIYNKFMSGVNLKFVFHIPFLNVYTVTNNYYIGPENLYISTASYDTAYNSNGFSKLTILDFVIMLTNNNDIHIGQVSRSM